MKVPLIKPDLPSLEEISEPLREVIASGKVTNFGRYMAMFEKEASNYLGVDTACVSSGTVGLILALQAAGLKPGEKIILPSFTFVATGQAVLYAGGEPIFAEVGEDFNLSLADLEFLLNKYADVTGVIPVHMFGIPTNTEEIQGLVEQIAKCRGKRIFVIYDAAHAFGSEVNGRKVGSFGDAEVFSFSVTKLLVSIEGGMVASRNIELIERVRKMRNYGIQENYNTYYPGLNAKMSEFHAIVGLYNLRRIRRLLEIRQCKADYYLRQLSRLTQFQIPKIPAGVTQTFKDFTILISKEKVEKRDTVMEFLADRGIETRAYFYPPLHKQDFFLCFADRELAFTEMLSRRVITLPFYTSITNAEMDYVVDTLCEAERSIL